MASYTFGTAAAAGFEVLWGDYNSTTFGGNLWFAGNTFHTCLDYLINAGLKDTKGVVQQGYDVYTDVLPQFEWWRDDYGWWGDSFVLAIEHREALGLTGSKYDDLFEGMAAQASYCWQRMNNVWTASSTACRRIMPRPPATSAAASSTFPTRPAIRSCRAATRSRTKATGSSRSA